MFASVVVLFFSLMSPPATRLAHLWNVCPPMRRSLPLTTTGRTCADNISTNTYYTIRYDIYTYIYIITMLYIITYYI